MEYAAYASIIALLVGFLEYRRRRAFKARNFDKQSCSVRIFEPESDPLKERIEFHISKD